MSAESLEEQGWTYSTADAARALAGRALRACAAAAGPAISSAVSSLTPPFALAPLAVLREVIDVSIEMPGSRSLRQKPLRLPHRISMPATTIATTATMGTYSRRCTASEGWEEGVSSVARGS